MVILIIVGYGDVVFVIFLGCLFGGVIILVSMGMVVILIGLLVLSFFE